MAIQLTLMHDKKGFTLIEVMVAILIMMVGVLGLLSTMNVAMKHNVENQRREEVVRVAEEIMNDMRTRQFNFQNIDPSFNPMTTVTSKLRSSPVTYGVIRRPTTISPGVTDQYQVDVRWAYKNYSALHTIVTIRGN